MIHESHQSPFEQQADGSEDAYLNIVNTLTTTLELVGEELFRLKLSSSKSTVSAHDSRFSTKLESILRTFDKFSDLKVWSFQKVTQILNKLVNKSRNLASPVVSSTTEKQTRGNFHSHNQNMYVMPGKARAKKCSKRKSIMSQEDLQIFPAPLEDICQLSPPVCTPKVTSKNSFMPNFKKSFIKPPTAICPREAKAAQKAQKIAFPTPEAYKTQDRPSQIPSKTPKSYCKPQGKKRGNIVTFTPGKLNQKRRLTDRDGESTSVFSDTKSILSSGF